MNPDDTVLRRDRAPTITALPGLDELRRIPSWERGTILDQLDRAWEAAHRPGGAAVAWTRWATRDGARRALPTSSGRGINVFRRLAAHTILRGLHNRRA